MRGLSNIIFNTLQISVLYYQLNLLALAFNEDKLHLSKIEDFFNFSVIQYQQLAKLGENIKVPPGEYYGWRGNSCCGNTKLR